MRAGWVTYLGKRLEAVEQRKGVVSFHHPIFNADFQADEVVARTFEPDPSKTVKPVLK